MMKESIRNFGTQLKVVTFVIVSVMALFIPSLVRHNDYVYGQVNLTAKTIDGEEVSLAAQGKPKVIIIGQVGCWNCAAVMSDLREAKLDADAVDYIYVEIKETTTVERLTSYKNNNGSPLVKYILDRDLAWNLIRKTSPTTREITTPFIIYKNANDEVVEATMGVLDIIKEIKSALGVDPLLPVDPNYDPDDVCLGDFCGSSDMSDEDLWEYLGSLDNKPSHIHSLKTTTIAATATSDGKKVTTCVECGEYNKVETIYAAKTIKLSNTKYSYDGKVKKPSVTIKDSKGYTIDSSNYTVTYSKGRKNVGTYTVKVIFKGDYEGTKKLSFKINPPKTSISKLIAGRKVFLVNWSKKTNEVAGYEIQYSTSSAFKSGNKTVKVSSAKAASKKISNLKGKQTYYVRIRTYKTVNGTTYCSAWSAKKYVTTKQ